MTGIEDARQSFLAAVQSEKHGYHWETNRVARELVEQYDKWTPVPPIGTDAIEVFAPTLLRRPGRRPHLLSSVQTSDMWEWAREVLHVCLYVDRLWIPDPLEILADDLIDYSWDLSIHQPLIEDPKMGVRVNQLLSDDLSSLVEAGTIVLYPAMRLYRKAVSELLFGYHRGFTDYELRSAWPELYVAEGLAYAGLLNASYTALHRDEFAALEKAGQAISNTLSVADGRVLAILPRVKLPFFEGLDTTTLVKVRSGEEAFADFRAFLREMSGTLVAGLEDPRFDDEVAAMEAKRMTPALETLERQITGISFLKSRFAEAGIDFTAGALAGMALKGDIPEALMAGTMTALSKAVVKLIVSREKTRPAASVVYQFHSGRPFSSVF